MLKPYLITPCRWKIEREENYTFMSKFLSNFAGDLPTKYEVEAQARMQSDYMICPSVQNYDASKTSNMIYVQWYVQWAVMRIIWLHHCWPFDFLAGLQHLQESLVKASQGYELNAHFTNKRQHEAIVFSFRIEFFPANYFMPCPLSARMSSSFAWRQAWARNETQMIRNMAMHVSNLYQRNPKKCRLDSARLIL